MPIGGQAVIEGVMMQNGRRVAVAVRTPGGEIALRDLERTRRFPKVSKIPFIRGPLRLYDILSLGIRALNLSVELATEEEEELGKWSKAVVTVGALALALGAFVVLPNFLATFTQIPQRVLFNLAEGGIRVTVLLVYMFAISRQRDIRRVFQYHGAEHKAVHAYEAGHGSSASAARSHSPVHPRCGTAFLLMFVLVAVLVFSVLPAEPLWLRLLGRLALLPVVAGFTYEVLLLGGRHPRALWLRPLLMPGLLLQRLLTTREPTDDQLEVAVAALRHVTEDAAPASLSTTP
ncbi:MAG: DUF1385 domain-containing protein [Candidatus Bipolaricaulota bacterium]